MVRRTVLAAVATPAVLVPLTSAGTAQAEVRTFTATTALDGRTVQDPSVPVGRKRVADMYLKGQKVNVVCQDTGPVHGGRNVWDLTTEGLWGAGLDIGAWTGAQHTKGRAVAIGDRKPGDLVFWGRSDNDPDSTTHVAVYLGDNKILEASPPRDGQGVRISDLSSHGTPCSKVRRIFG